MAARQLGDAPGFPGDSCGAVCALRLDGRPQRHRLPLSDHLDNEGYGAGYGFHVVWVLRDLELWAPSGRVYVAVMLVPLGALGLWTLLRRPADELRPAHLVILAAAFVFATSPHYAWYFGWLVPLLVRQLSPAVLGLTLLALLQNYPGNPQWATPTFFYATIFGGFFAMAIMELLWRLRSAK